MLSKLPRWVWHGAWMLAFIAGFVNAIGLLGFEHQAVTHLTGTSSLLAVALSRLSLREAGHFLAVIGSFLAGCTASGFILKNSVLRFGRSYATVLLLEAMLLCGAVPLLEHGHAVGMYMATCACGLQNAMASTYSGALVRTTHLTGIFTDIGVHVGLALRKASTDPLRLRMSGIVLTGFLSGGTLGALAFARMAFSALYIPGLLTAIGAVLYLIAQKRAASKAPDSR